MVYAVSHHHHHRCHHIPLPAAAAAAAAAERCDQTETLLVMHVLLHGSSVLHSHTSFLKRMSNFTFFPVALAASTATSRQAVETYIALT